ncbi:MAG: hypothetical protein MRY74_16945 [Neomegalonema sp.]|nr:hypothetical protein [Neomegalonema sp.]
MDGMDGILSIWDDREGFVLLAAKGTADRGRYHVILEAPADAPARQEFLGVFDAHMPVRAATGWGAWTVFPVKGDSFILRLRNTLDTQTSAPGRQIADLELRFEKELTVRRQLRQDADLLAHGVLMIETDGEQRIETVEASSAGQTIPNEDASRLIQQNFAWDSSLGVREIYYVAQSPFETTRAGQRRETVIAPSRLVWPSDRRTVKVGCRLANEVPMEPMRPDDRDQDAINVHSEAVNSMAFERFAKQSYTPVEMIVELSGGSPEEFSAIQSSITALHLRRDLARLHKVRSDSRRNLLIDLLFRNNLAERDVVRPLIDEEYVDSQGYREREFGFENSRCLLRFRFNHLSLGDIIVLAAPPTVSVELRLNADAPPLPEQKARPNRFLLRYGVHRIDPLPTDPIAEKALLEHELKLIDRAVETTMRGAPPRRESARPLHECVLVQASKEFNAQFQSDLEDEYEQPIALEPFSPVLLAAPQLAHAVATTPHLQSHIRETQLLELAESLESGVAETGDFLSFALRCCDADALSYETRAYLRSLSEIPALRNAWEILATTRDGPANLALLAEYKVRLSGRVRQTTRNGAARSTERALEFLRNRDHMTRITEMLTDLDRRNYLEELHGLIEKLDRREPIRFEELTVVEHRERDAIRAVREELEMVWSALDRKDKTLHISDAVGADMRAEIGGRSAEQIKAAIADALPRAVVEPAQRELLWSRIAPVRTRQALAIIEQELSASGKGAETDSIIFAVAEALLQWASTADSAPARLEADQWRALRLKLTDNILVDAKTVIQGYARLGEQRHVLGPIAQAAQSVYAAIQEVENRVHDAQKDLSPDAVDKLDEQLEALWRLSYAAFVTRSATALTQVLSAARSTLANTCRKSDGASRARISQTWDRLGRAFAPDRALHLFDRRVTADYAELSELAGAQGVDQAVLTARPYGFTRPAALGGAFGA